MAKKDVLKTTQFKCEVGLLAKFKAEAKRQGLTFSNFIRHCMAKECELRDLERRKAGGSNGRHEG